MNHFVRGVALALALASSACASLSHQQRDRAAAIAAAARSDQVTCAKPDHCAQPSPIHALGGAAMTESTPEAPRHYALILDEGEDALLARVNLLRSATRYIDLQTYIFDKDDSARLIMDELLAAARRGVKVRLLIDQLSAISDVEILAALSGAHENFRIRIYNPTFGKAKLNYFDYAGSVLCCFRRFNQRMHTKSLLVDDVVGITGGRNYQDDYYDWDSEYNFRDRDLMVTGPVARTMAANFDAFWNAPRSVPAERLNDVGRHLLRHGVPPMPPENFLRPDRIERVQRDADDAELIALRFARRALPVGEVLFIADLPQKHRRERPKDSAPAAPELAMLIDSAKEEILLQTPYLVLSKEAQALFRELRQRPQPPRVTISTNSLAATDNPVVYSISYKYKRRYLRKFGFNIYEYKPFPLDPPVDAANLLAPAPTDTAESLPGDEPEPVPDSAQTTEGSEVTRRTLRTETRPSFLSSQAANKPLPLKRKGSRMGLHAKSMVVDGQVGVVGTHNFDPRSENYNTESAIVIRDPVFAQALSDSIRRDMSPENSWVVAPRTKPVVFSGLDYSLGKMSESLPIFDLWPWRYATDYEFSPGPECPLPLPRQHPEFNKCYVAVGDFPDVNMGPKWLLTRMLTAFGAGLVPIL